MDVLTLHGVKTYSIFNPYLGGLGVRSSFQFGLPFKVDSFKMTKIWAVATKAKRSFSGSDFIMEYLTADITSNIT